MLSITYLQIQYLEIISLHLIVVFQWLVLLGSLEHFWEIIF